ncbi:hypothetical protein, partial [Coxiella burnetii]|uniref:hypothetical protein n=1 Tax=Coxiella burnetii TaxID=777 RepID=UPI00398CCFA8
MERPKRSGMWEPKRIGDMVTKKERIGDKAVTVRSGIQKPRRTGKTKTKKDQVGDTERPERIGMMNTKEDW